MFRTDKNNRSPHIIMRYTAEIMIVIYPFIIIREKFEISILTLCNAMIIIHIIWA